MAENTNDAFKYRRPIVITGLVLILAAVIGGTIYSVCTNKETENVVLSDTTAVCEQVDTCETAEVVVAEDTVVAE